MAMSHRQLLYEACCTTQELGDVAKEYDYKATKEEQLAIRACSLSRAASGRMHPCNHTGKVGLTPELCCSKAACPAHLGLWRGGLGVGHHLAQAIAAIQVRFYNIKLITPILNSP